MGSLSLWQRFQNYFLRYDGLDFSIDISRMKFPDDFFLKMQPRIGKALPRCTNWSGARLPIRMKSGWSDQVREKLSADAGQTAEEIARSIDADPEDVFHVLRHLARNDSHVRVTAGDELADDKFSLAK